MANWHASMQQTFEFYEVDPDSWADVRKLTHFRTGTLVRDSSQETLGNANFDIDEIIDEMYVRVYLVVVQNGFTEKFPLGTYLCQSPEKSFNGFVASNRIQAFTPLIELKEKSPELGYSVRRKRNILDAAYNLTRENLRAPVVKGKASETLYENFVSNINDTWLKFLTDLLANASHSFDLDEMGRVLFAPIQNASAMRPVWTYTDDEMSILEPEISLDRDIYNLPNVCEVVYSSGEQTVFSRAVNKDPNSLISTVNRGREILYRETDPEIGGDSDVIGRIPQEHLDVYTRSLLKQKSSVEFTITYTHGYCPVRVGDCVLINYQRAGLNNVRAKVTRQSIRLEPGCPVEETAVYTQNLWED